MTNVDEDRKTRDILDEEEFRLMLEQAKDNEFIGGQLFYDHKEQVMKIIGSESFPCQFNGALADEIVYDLKTDTVKADLVGPGALRLQ